MILKRLLIVLAICAACKPAPKQETRSGAGPQTAATVVTVRTTVGQQVTSHAVVIANGRARSTGERDVWRLYDTKADTVTFVDDVDRTYRTEPLGAILQKRRRVMASALPSHYPRSKVSRNGTKAILGLPAQELLIELGAYRRELWIARHPAIPDELFSMMVASDPPSSPIASMMAQVDEQLLFARGFPLVDRSEVPLGKGTNVVNRAVTGIASRQVPVALLTVPREYRDVTPKPAPAKTKAKGRSGVTRERRPAARATP